MKKTLVLICSLAVVAPAIIHAATFRTGDQVSAGANERISENIYMTGGTVTSASAITGDLVAAGGTVVVNGTVGSDIAAAGGTVTILAPTAGDVRVVGGTIVLQHGIGGDVVAGGGHIVLGGTGVKGDAALAGGSIRIDAPVSKNLTARGGSVYINAPISGKVYVDAETLTLGSGAVISGDLTYRATKVLTKDDGAVIRGQVHFEPKAAKTLRAGMSTGALLALFSVLLIGKFLTLLVSALLIGLLLRRFAAEIVARATSRPLLELGRGLIAVTSIPVISVFLLMTIFGIPFAILGFLGFMALVVFSWILAPIVIGSVAYGYLSKRAPEVSWKSILLGVVIYSVVGLLPFVGWLALALVRLLALGAIVAIKIDIGRQWK